jgi:hypothetical protein
MTRTIAIGAVVGVLIVAGLVWRPGSAAAAPGCNAADLNGGYALSFTAVSGLPGSAEYDAFAGLWTFDGAGKMSGRGARMEHGAVVGAGAGITGTYEVTPDCGGVIHLNVGGSPSEAVFFGSNRMARLHFILRDRGNAAAGFADKQ